MGGRAEGRVRTRKSTGLTMTEIFSFPVQSSQDEEFLRGGIAHGETSDGRIGTVDYDVRAKRSPAIRAAVRRLRTLLINRK